MDNGEKGSSLHLIQTAKSLSVKLAQILNRYKITRLILRYFHNNFNIHEAYSTIGLVHKPQKWEMCCLLPPFLASLSNLQIRNQRICRHFIEQPSWLFCSALWLLLIKLSPSKSQLSFEEVELTAILAINKGLTDMKPSLCLVLKPMGDFPGSKYMGQWDALCTTQQRPFHGQSADPLTGVQLRQCNPKLFNQITRAWEKNSALNYAWG